MKYKSTTVAKAFLYRETRKAANLINEGTDIKDLKQIAVEDNIFQLPSDHRSIRVAGVIVRRLKELDNYLTEKIVEGSLETSKAIVLYSIAKCDRLFFEFMNEVYKECILLGKKEITVGDFNLFFQTKKEQSEVVNSWSDDTFKKLKQVFIKLLIDSGLLIQDLNGMQLTTLIVDSNVLNYIYDLGDRVYIDAVIGNVN